MVPGGLSDLLDALAGTAPQQPAWSWIGDQRVAFWYRRLAHETAVHRWDAERAAGIAPAPIQPEELAADGVAEVFDTWLGHADPPYEGPPGTLHLHATDAEAEWLLTLQPPQVTAAPGHGRADTALRGTASDLDLLLWGRLPLAAVEVLGDPVLPVHSLRGCRETSGRQALARMLPIIVRLRRTPSGAESWWTSMTTPENAKQPKVGEFRIELWGYERRSVDALVAELMHRLSETQPAAFTPGQVEVAALRQRVAELEAGTPAQADVLPAAGAEAGRLLVEIAKLAEGVQRRALELAHQTVANAEAKAATLLATARERAQEQEQAAERALAEAERIRGEAEHEARLAAQRAVEQARAQVEQDAEALRADVDRLVEVRDRLAADLARVRGQVETLLRAPDDPGEVATLKAVGDRRAARRPAQA